MTEREETRAYQLLLDECRDCPDAEKVCEKMDSLVRIGLISVEMADYAFRVLIHRERPWPKKG